MDPNERDGRRGIEPWLRAQKRCGVGEEGSEGGVDLQIDGSGPCISIMVLHWPQLWSICSRARAISGSHPSFGGRCCTTFAPRAEPASEGGHNCDAFPRHKQARVRSAHNRKLCARISARAGGRADFLATRAARGASTLPWGDAVRGGIPPSSGATAGPPPLGSCPNKPSWPTGIHV